MPPVGLVVEDGRIHDARGGVREIEAAAEAVAADDAGPADGLVAADGRVRHEDGRGVRRLDGAVDAPALALAAVAAGAAVTARDPVAGDRASGSR